ncbi:hypothetical protein B0T14DRAFT_498817 [Immersiella caudata]|uniref:Uncharacterized protein n=1 Tax=Immersiella caudata TaxID=314043 RepID=A0AA39WDA5_9PEZI|nr:hypothetical protein B0T14DRAFT_498817 [Immersiella caudata]
MSYNHSFAQQPSTFFPQQQELQFLDWYLCANPTCATDIVWREHELCQQCVNHRWALKEAAKLVPGPCQQPHCPHINSWHGGNSEGICDNCWMDIFDKAAWSAEARQRQSWGEGNAMEDVQMTFKSEQQLDFQGLVIDTTAYEARYHAEQKRIAEWVLKSASVSSPAIKKEEVEGHQKTWGM